jgi:ABC-type multidrug transport system ATPase subunit
LTRGHLIKFFIFLKKLKKKNIFFNPKKKKKKRKKNLGAPRSHPHGAKGVAHWLLSTVIAEPRQQILKGVNLCIYDYEGGVHAIMGKNGSGKST